MAESKLPKFGAHVQRDNHVSRMTTTHPSGPVTARPGVIPVNSPRQVLFASLVGTTIEFFDFYIYGTAAVLVFPALFFPASDRAAATLASDRKSTRLNSSHSDRSRMPSSA